MGGFGSGRRWHFGAKDTTDGCRSIDVRRWQRDGLLIPGKSFGWNWNRNGETVADISVRMETGRVFLTYRYRANGSEWESLNYPVTLDSTPCTYGNLRYWFHCPAVGCGRRVALLYLGGRYFACRHCYNLAYASQRESDGGRALNRAQRIREKMGGSANLFEPFPWKPKGMHWRTYSRLRNQAEQSSNQSMLYA